jgi:hypothetical protein
MRSFSRSLALCRGPSAGTRRGRRGAVGTRAAGGGGGCEEPRTVLSQGHELPEESEEEEAGEVESE